MCKHRLNPQKFSELLSQPAYGNRFRSCNVKDLGGRIADGQRADGDLACVSLPDYASVSHTQVDRVSVLDRLCDFKKDPVTRFDCIAKTKQDDWCVVPARKMFENTFPAHTRLRVFADRPRRMLFCSAPESDRGEWVHEKRRKSNDARVLESFRHPTRQVGVHRPREVLISG